MIEASTKALKAFTPSSTSKPKQAAPSASKMAGTFFVDLVEGSVSLIIVKDAIRSSGRFLSESPAVIIAAQGAHVQSVIIAMPCELGNSPQM